MRFVPNGFINTLKSAWLGTFLLFGECNAPRSYCNYFGVLHYFRASTAMCESTCFGHNILYFPSWNRGKKIAFAQCCGGEEVMTTPEIVTMQSRGAGSPQIEVIGHDVRLGEAMFFWRVEPGFKVGTLVYWKGTLRTLCLVEEVWRRVVLPPSLPPSQPIPSVFQRVEKNTSG